jgi:hypothetical protein
MTTETEAKTEEPYERTTGPVHAKFGLTYANFLVIHRAHLQSMPLPWQRQFVDLLEDLDAAYPDLDSTEFEVRTVRDAYVEELTEDELALLGITRDDGENETAYTGKDGTEMRAGLSHVGIPVPDPIPHYRHAYLPPDEAAITAARQARETERARHDHR